VGTDGGWRRYGREMADAALRPTWIVSYRHVWSFAGMVGVVLGEDGGDGGQEQGGGHWELGTCLLLGWAIRQESTQRSSR